MKKTLLLGIVFGMGATLSANAAWEEMEMKSYPNLQENPIELYYTPATDGVLTMSKWGGYNDPYLWTNEACTDGYYVIPTNIINGFEGETIYTFALVEGETYYSKAPLNADDNIDELAFAWEPSSDDNVESITEGTPFSAFNKVMKFTAPETGFLSVFVTPYIWNIVGDTWSFLYTDVNHGNYVPVLNVSGDQTDNGAYYYFQVTEGKTYYFYQEYSSSARFTFEMTDEIPVKILNILPAPGTAFDPVNFIGGAQMFFTPTKVDFSKITFDYEVDGETVSKTVSSEYYSDALMLNIYNLYNEALPLVEAGSECTITLYDVNFDGSPVTGSDVEGVSLADGNVSFNYIFDYPIELVDATWPEEMLAYWPAGDPAGVATLEFSQNIKSVSNVLMAMGRQYYNSAPFDENAQPDPYYVIDNVEFEGNILTIDFTGVERAESKYDVVTIFVNGIIGENGLELAYPLDSYNGTIPVIQWWLPYVDNSETEGPGTGVGVISTETIGFKVFNMLGAKVMDATDASQLNGLKPGIYMINGKKMIIK